MTSIFKGYRKKIVLLLAILIFFIIYLGRFSMWLSHPFSNSYEEYGTVATLNSYLEGVNPYSFESFPERSFIYGPFYAWICSFIYQLIGLHYDHLMFCRLVSVLFLIATEIVVINTIIKSINPSIDKFSKVLLLLIASGALVSVSWQMTPVSGYSNTFGVFLTAIIYNIVTSKDSHKIRNLTLCSLLSVIAFFVKQYFIIVFVVASVQLIIQKKRKQLLYLLLSFLFFIILGIAICQIFMPTSLYVLVEAMSHQQMSFFHSIKQWTIFIIFYFPYFFALAYVLKNDKIAFHYVPATYKSGVLVAMICLTYIGCNKGAYLWYFYHLLLLPLVVCGTIALSYIRRRWTWMMYLLSIIFCLFHVNMNTVAPRYPKDVTEKLKTELNNLSNEYDLSKSYNFHASLDDWAYKNKMGYVNSLYPNFLLMMRDKESAFFFGEEHRKAQIALNAWETKLKNHINNKDAELIICNSNDRILKRNGLDVNYKLLKILRNPDGDPKYINISVYIKR